MTKTIKLLNALQRGSSISVSQAISRFGFLSPNAVTSVIRNLRNQGHNVQNVTKNGTVRYTLN
jgi:hypothetical protein